MVDDEHDLRDLVDLVELFVADLLLSVPVSVPFLIHKFHLLLFQADIVVQSHDALAEVVLLLCVVMLHPRKLGFSLVKLLPQLAELVFEHLVASVDRTHVLVLGWVLSSNLLKEVLIGLDSLAPFLNAALLLTQNLNLPFFASNLVRVALKLNLVFLDVGFEGLLLLLVGDGVGRVLSKCVAQLRVLFFQLLLLVFNGDCLFVLVLTLFLLVCLFVLVHQSAFLKESGRCTFVLLLWIYSEQVITSRGSGRHYSVFHLFQI